VAATSGWLLLTLLRSIWKETPVLHHAWPILQFSHEQLQTLPHEAARQALVGEPYRQRHLLPAP
jgi:hypothetical protein